eukprot:TRINITY_DN5128_c0_g1_i3.p1 TRINITY_DN5128_c0_g1~~TRINITY_DN5128_c0_g1_i3.p1  ORF type:complete len:138 (-),score=63.17 TRINITY_DN5128_c0_g1_i3:127-483(-)
MVKALESGDKKDVIELASEIFVDIRKRILRNVLLKLYNFFYVPMSVDLYMEIQEKVTNLPKAKLHSLFELDNNLDKISDIVKRLQKIIQQCTDQEIELLEASHHFFHPALERPQVVLH